MEKKHTPSSKDVAAKLLATVLQYQFDLDQKPNKTEAEKRHLEKLRQLRR
jgi:hypothetical protein